MAIVIVNINYVTSLHPMYSFKVNILWVGFCIFCGNN